MTTETQHLAILLNSATPDRPEICVSPLIHALAAKALDCEVEIHFSGPSIRLLVAGVAEALYPTPQQEKSILSFIKEAYLQETLQVQAVGKADAFARFAGTVVNLSDDPEE